MRYEAMISFEGVCHQYQNKVQALDNIDLEIKKGEFMAIVGKNGCGKSTLMRHINALLLPTKGRVLIDGMDTADPANILKIRQSIGMVFQNPQTQFVGTTVEEDIAFGPENLALTQDEIKKRVDMALEEVHLSNFRQSSPRSLSGGQMQRVAIAGALAMQPECIVLDEVTSMLDSLARSQVMETIQELRRGKKTVIYSTHLLEEIIGADRVILMDSGRIVMDAPPDSVLNSSELHELGFNIPPMVELANMLHSSGLVRERKYSHEGLLEEICRSMSGT